MVITYTALSRIISGHVSGSIYQIEIGTKQADPDGETYLTEHVSLNGTREVVKQDREDDNWTVATKRITTADLLELREFFYSVVGGETFTLDLYGTIAVPDDVQTMVMLSKKYAPKRIKTSDYFNFSFKARVDV